MKKRSIKKVPGTNEETLVTLIKKIRNKKIRSYAAFTYLFGNRVSEGIGIRKTTITGYYEYERTTKKGTKKIYIKKTVNKEQQQKGIIEYEIEPIRAWQIEYEEKKNLLWCRSIHTLKIPGRPVRDSWVLTDGPNEKELVEIVLEHTKKRIEEEGETAYLWELTRNNVYKAFRKHLGINNFPHKIRDQRATKDSTTYGLDAKDLKEKYHWQTSEMAMYYGSKNKTDIIDKMRRTNKSITENN